MVISDCLIFFFLLRSFCIFYHHCDHLLCHFCGNFFFIVFIFVFIIVHYFPVVIIIGFTVSLSGTISIVSGRYIVAVTNFDTHRIATGQFKNPINDIMSHGKFFQCFFIESMDDG